MGRIKGRDSIKSYMKKYGGSGVDFFKLENDKDTAKVRFFNSDDQDLGLYLIHLIEVEGKERRVECLEEGCPLCATLGQPSLKLFLALYDYGDDKVKVWERGTQLVEYLLGFMDKKGPLNNRDYEIVRHGKKGDNKTSYQFFDEDKKPFEEIFPDEATRPQRPEIYGRFIYQWTKEGMRDFIEENAPKARERKGKKDGPGF